MTLSEDTQVLTAEEREVRRKERKREYDRQYRATHRGERREASQRYYAAHQEEERSRNRERGRLYYAEHLEECLERNRRYRVAHPEERRAYRQRYYLRPVRPGKKACVGCGKTCMGRNPEPRCRTCAAQHYRGKKSGSYRGGCVRSDGYRVLTNGRGCHSFEHRIIWEAVHGPLPRGWHVHHLNGDKADNRLCNLLAMPNGSHVKLHNLLTSGAFTLHSAAKEARQMMAGKAPTLAQALKALKAQCKYERKLLKPNWAGRMTPVERTYVCQVLFKETRKLLDRSSNVAPVSAGAVV